MKSIYLYVTVQTFHIRWNKTTMEKIFTQKKIAEFNINMKCEHWVKRFVCLMYNCTDLNILFDYVNCNIFISLKGNRQSHKYEGALLFLIL